MPDPETTGYAAATATLSGIAMPVAIIGAAGRAESAESGERSCATGTLMYVSLAPPQVAIAMHPGSRTSRLARSSGSFSVSLLGADQLDLAIAAGHGARTADKFLELGIPTIDPPTPSRPSVPGIQGSIAVLWCRVVDEIETGDHVVLIGSVEQHIGDASSGLTAGDRGDRQPLVRYQRRYLGLEPAAGIPATDGYPV
jgi:3-hydroxy-9,10-secoandrosta-1,3,5(10)-triene-9,17-dione monooxygenase reductase component